MNQKAQQREQTHAQILSAASRTFRTEGIENSGIGKIMNSIGMTVGGFYNHFDSKSSLVHEVIDRNVSTVVEGDEPDAKQAVHSLDEILDMYLSEAHREDVANGCLLPCLSSEIARADDDVREAYTAFVRRMFDKLMPAVESGGGLSKRQRAMSIVATAVGGLMLARAVNDKAVSQQILAACRKAAGQI